MTIAWSNFIWLYILPSFNISATSGTNWFWLGECAPGLSALLLTWIDERSKGVRELLKTITIWRVNPFYYYLILVLLPFFYCAAIGITALQGAYIPSIQSLYPKIYSGWFGVKFYRLSMIPLFTILYIFCEELGWRGYALPKLMQRYDAFTASIIIGVVWSLFHIPLMKYSVLVAHPSFFLLYTFSTVTGSLFYSWLYLKTNRSLLLVGLLHALSDFYGLFSPSIISPLGQGEKGLVIMLHFLLCLPIYVLLFRDRCKFQSLIRTQTS